MSDSVDNLDDDLAEIVGYLTVSRDVTGHRLTRVFRDWVEMAVCAFESNDEVYLDVLDRHMPDHCDQDDRREVAEAFSEALGELLTSTLDKQRPVIGDIYEAIGANSDAFGQFFTGWPLCRTKARMTITEDDALEATVDDPLTVADPACGSGRLLVAAANRLHDIDPSAEIAVSGTDKDQLCAHMAVLNLVIANVRGRVRFGDSITMEYHREWRVDPRVRPPVQRVDDPDSPMDRLEEEDEIGEYQQVQLTFAERGEADD